jgi:predicted HD phosphohydrolase
LLDHVSKSEIDFLVFSQDDSGEFGLNVLEQDKLLKSAQNMGISRKVMSYPGSDETLSALIGRALLESSMRRPLASLTFSTEYGSRTPSNYEGQTIGETVEQQTHALGLVLTNDNDALLDLQIIVHCLEHRQGDHIQLPGHPSDLRLISSADAVRRCIELLEKAQKPVVLCDVAYANGADPALVSELLKRPELLKKLWSYAGWNTTGNTVGSALALGVARWYSEQNAHSETRERYFQEAMFVRLADDWAYQTQVRTQLNGQAVPDGKLAELMRPYLSEIGAASGWSIPAVHVSLPWKRTFEIEVAITQ